MARFRRKPVVLLTDYRNGGTFLALALDSHPAIATFRGEPLSRRKNPWSVAFPRASSDQILRAALSQPLCEVSLCKVTFRQMSKQCWALVEALDVSILLLTRRNVLRASVSALVRKGVQKGLIPRKGHPLHARSYIRPSKVDLSPTLLLAECKAREVRLDRARRHLDSACLELDYTDVVGYEGASVLGVVPEVAGRICDFLNVQARPLVSNLRKLHCAPLRELLLNWSEVEAVVKDSPYAHCLEDEVGWTRMDGKWRRTLFAQKDR